MKQNHERPRLPSSEAHREVAAAARALAEGERVRGQALLALAEAAEREAHSFLDDRMAHALKHQAEIARTRAETSAHKATTYAEEAKSEETAAVLADQRARITAHGRQGSPEAAGEGDVADLVKP